MCMSDQTLPTGRARVGKGSGSRDFIAATQTKTETLFPPTNSILGRARYRPIDDRARFWSNFFWTRFGKWNLENFQRTKKQEKEKRNCRD